MIYFAKTVEWRSIPGIKTRCQYEVSCDGRVRRLLASGKWKIIKGSLNDNGYRVFDLYWQGVRTVLGFHQAVARAFIANPTCLPEVHHKDGNTKNNRVRNLRWVTHRENILAAFAGYKRKRRVRDHRRVPHVVRVRGTEVWASCTFDRRYSVSDWGRVRREVGAYRRRVRMLALATQDGYVVCYINGKMFRVHRLVAVAFLVNPCRRKTVNHRNRRRHDNRVSNLEWSTHCQQMKHVIAGGYDCARRGEGNGRSVLTVARVRHIRASRASVTSLASRFGVSSVQIRKVRARRAWRNVL